MYKIPKYRRSSIKRNESKEGETIETKIERFLTNKEPIGEETQLIYTERKNGIMPAYNIKADRFEIAIEAMDKVDKSSKARRANRLNSQNEVKVIDLDTKGESAQGNTGQTE